MRLCRASFASLFLLAGCGTVTDPQLEMDPSRVFPTAVRAAAFEVEISGEMATIVAEPAGPPEDRSFLNAASVQLLVGAVTRSPADAHGHRRVSVQVGVRNRTGSPLVTARDEARRAGVPAGLLLVPLEVWVPEIPGSVAVEQGTDVMVTLPNRGAAELAGWLGAPAPFFGAAHACHEIDVSCRPFELLGAPVEPLDVSDTRELTFDVEVTVRVMRFRVLVAGALSAD